MKCQLLFTIPCCGCTSFLIIFPITSSEQITLRSAFPSNASPSETLQLDGDERSRLYTWSPTVNTTVPCLCSEFTTCKQNGEFPRVLWAIAIHLIICQNTHLELPLQWLSSVPDDGLFHGREYLRRRTHITIQIDTNNTTIVALSDTIWLVFDKVGNRDNQILIIYPLHIVLTRNMFVYMGIFIYKDTYDNLYLTKSSRCTMAISCHFTWGSYVIRGYSISLFDHGEQGPTI